ncbi:unnamed protein product [Thelazia callipaeda]|uniref:FLYWCH-type domain-containing protein n=1 Tax=Thelazia callipaeda TaxID=103827 RepID=A0A0N5CZ00_THECL|nr:unnamed protein product [Thelazia callipaeda]
MKIRSGASFSSIQEFLTFFEAYKIVNFAPFRVGNSELLKQKDESVEFVNRFKYKYVNYHCARYGPIRCRGRNIRRYRSYFALHCDAVLRLRLSRDTLTLRITTFRDEHSHAQNEEKYLRVVGRRKRGELKYRLESKTENAEAATTSAAIKKSKADKVNNSAATRKNETGEDSTPVPIKRRRTKQMIDSDLDTTGVIDSNVSPENLNIKDSEEANKNASVTDQKSNISNKVAINLNISDSARESEVTSITAEGGDSGTVVDSTTNELTARNDQNGSSVVTDNPIAAVTNDQNPFVLGFVNAVHYNLFYQHMMNAQFNYMFYVTPYAVYQNQLNE